MKHLIILCSFLMTIIISSTALAGNPVKYKKIVDKAAVENLLEGIKSENFGLKLSSAFYLGEYGCTEAVIPLLKMLKSDQRVEARISAALSLYKLGDARGLFAIKEAVRFDHSQRVKRICSHLYSAYMKPAAQVETLASK